MKTPEEKYRNDASFKVLVDMMVAHINDCKYTPSEMREAAMLSSIIHERLNIRRYYLKVDEEAETHIGMLHKWVKERVV